MCRWDELSFNDRAILYSTDSILLIIHNQWLFERLNQRVVFRGGGHKHSTGRLRCTWTCSTCKKSFKKKYDLEQHARDTKHARNESVRQSQQQRSASNESPPQSSRSSRYTESMPMRGNCLFNAFSFFRYGEIHRHIEMRRHVMKHVKENPSKFKSYFLPTDSHPTWESYISVMSHPAPTHGPTSHHWSRDLEVAAAADLYKWHILVFDDKDGEPIHRFGETRCTEQRLYFRHGSHYDVVVDNSLYNIHLNNVTTENFIISETCDTSKPITKSKRSTMAKRKSHITALAKIKQNIDDDKIAEYQQRYKSRKDYQASNNKTPERKAQNNKSKQKSRDTAEKRRKEQQRRQDLYEADPNKHEKEKARLRCKWHDTMRRKRYESTDMGLHDKLIQRSIISYNPTLCPQYKHPSTKSQKSTRMEAAEIVNPDDPSYDDVENTDVWNKEYFEQWSQYCYACDDKTGKIDNTKLIHRDFQNTFEHIKNLLRVDAETMDNVCRKHVVNVMSVGLLPAQIQQYRNNNATLSPWMKHVHTTTSS